MQHAACSSCRSPLAPAFCWQRPSGGCGGKPDARAVICCCHSGRQFGAAWLNFVATLAAFDGLTLVRVPVFGMPVDLPAYWASRASVRAEEEHRFVLRNGQRSASRRLKHFESPAILISALRAIEGQVVKSRLSRLRARQNHLHSAFWTAQPQGERRNLRCRVCLWHA